MQKEVRNGPLFIYRNTLIILKLDQYPQSSWKLGLKMLAD